jgi:N-acetylmuramoyl-L-alanine amidase
VEEDPHTNKVAHRELAVRIHPVLKGKKVTWSYEAVPDVIPATIRGNLEHSPEHKNRFEVSTEYEGYEFEQPEDDDEKGKTTIADDGHTAIRVNVPPIGFNQVRIKIAIEGSDESVDLIDMEVPAVVSIDPGHGAKDSGAVGRTDKTVLEKDLTLAYGLQLRQKLIAKFKEENHGLRIVMTRKTSGGFLEVNDRATPARNGGADVLISIHFNDADNASARGTETFVERPPANLNQEEDADLADLVQQSTVSAIQSQDAGGAHRPTFENNWVLRDGAPIPGVKRAGYAVTKDGENYNGNSEDYHPVKACLVEVEFLCNETALNSVKLSNASGTAIQNAFSESVANDIFDNIRDQE